MIIWLESVDSNSESVARGFQLVEFALSHLALKN